MSLFRTLLEGYFPSGLATNILQAILVPPKVLFIGVSKFITLSAEGVVSYVKPDKNFGHPLDFDVSELKSKVIATGVHDISSLSVILEDDVDAEDLNVFLIYNDQKVVIAYNDAWKTIQFKEILTDKDIRQVVATEDDNAYITSTGEFIDEEGRVFATGIVKVVASRDENTYYLLTVTGELLAIDIEGTSHLTKENSNIFDIQPSFGTDMSVMIFTQDDFVTRGIVKISEVSDLQPLAILRNGDVRNNVPEQTSLRSGHSQSDIRKRKRKGAFKEDKVLHHYVHNIIYVANIRNTIVAINSVGRVLISKEEEEEEDFITVPRLNLLH